MSFPYGSGFAPSAPIPRRSLLDSLRIESDARLYRALAAGMALGALMLGHLLTMDILIVPRILTISPPHPETPPIVVLIPRDPVSGHPSRPPGKRHPRNARPPREAPAPSVNKPSDGPLGRTAVTVIARWLVA